MNTAVDSELNIFRFGSFELHTVDRLLFADGRQIPLAPKTMHILVLLVENHGRLIEKAQLLESVWPSSCVEEATLAQNVFTLRRLLGDHPGGGKYIQTIPRRGYRFVAPVQACSPPGESTVAAPATLGRRMLVVLPLENLSGDAELEYLADGFTEAFISELGGLDAEQLGVIARTSSMAYKGTRKTIREIAAELRIQFALEGSLRQSGERISITAQLVRADDQTHLWSRSYERRLHDALKLQSEIARAVAAEIRVRLTPLKQKLLGAMPAVAPAAYEPFIKGRYFWNKRTEDGLRAAIGCFQQSIDADPSFAPAHSGLAACWTLRALYGPYAPRDAFPLARAAALRALELDERTAEAHSMLALTHALFDFDWRGAEREFRRSLEIEPNNAFARSWYANYLAMMTRADEAFEQIRVAMRVDPLSPVVRMVYGLVLDVSGHNELALQEQEQVLRQSPHLYLNRTILGHNCCKLGRFAEGIEHLRQAYELSGRQPDFLAHLGCGYAFAGMHAAAREVLRELACCDRHVPPYSLARIHAGLGDIDQAVECMWDAYEERSMSMLTLPVDNWLAPAAGHPRYAELVRRLAFPTRAPEA